MAAPRPRARCAPSSPAGRGGHLLAALVAASLTLAPAAPSAADDCILLEDFSGSTLGAFPAGWAVRQDAGQGVYRVAEEAGRRFLRAVSAGLGIQAALGTPGWSLATHPVLAWAWRVRQFPAGGDERAPSANDSALAVYVGVPYSRVRGPRAVKYVWSERVPAGTRLSSNAGLTQVRVLRSGPSPAGEAWVEERVNVREEWKAAFRESVTPAVGGIGVLTDADDTRSTAAGDYADFRACRG